MDSDYFLHLTGIGREVAEKIYERHQFFTEQLVAAGIDQQTTEQEACRMDKPKEDSGRRVVGERGSNDLPPGKKGGETMTPDRHYEHKQHAL